VRYDPVQTMVDTGASVRNARAAGAAWFLGALALYWLTGARGLIWADPSKLTLYAASRYFPSLNPGDHAGWSVLAWAWLRTAGGDPVTAAHRLSGVCGALVVGMMALLWMRRGDRARAHTVAALVLAALPIWWASTVAETYAPALAATLGGALVLGQAPRQRWRWWVAGGLWGLAIAVHAMSAFLIVPLAWDAVRTRWVWLVPGAVVGSAPVWLAVFGAPRDPLTGFAAGDVSSWRWHWEAFLALARAPRNALVLAALMVYGIGLLGAAALWRGRREPRGSAVWAWSLGALALLLLTYATYRVHLMVGFLLVGLLLAVPVRLSATLRVGHVALQVLAYLAVPAALTIAGRQDLGVRVLPYRNNAFYFLCPIKGVRARLPVSSLDGAAGGASGGTLRFGGWRGMLDPGTRPYLATFGPCAPTGAAVLADFNPGAVLRLAQVARRWRPDLEVYPVAVDVALGAPDPVAALAARAGRELAKRGVVLADSYGPYYHPGALARRFDLRRCGPLVQVAPLPPGSLPRPWPS
jgi:hypothetical protein